MISEILIKEYNNKENNTEIQEFIQKIFKEEYQLDITHWENKEE